MENDSHGSQMVEVRGEWVLRPAGILLLDLAGISKLRGGGALFFNYLPECGVGQYVPHILL